ncbi:MAG: ABC transporter substrate-binding protein [Candidatus Krumholzibacteria bacterium]|nr:ABC transporter substrate-binding protein [Candidatus Krumholzibacteria bacterium]
MRHTMRQMGLCLLLAAQIAAPFGCANKDKAERGGTLIAGEINDYEGLNPMSTTDAHARDVYDLLFLSLLMENPDFLTFTPRLARSWEFSPDRLSLTFHLRDDVSWSDGMPFTAHDVEATFAAQKDSLTLWSGRHLKQHIDSVTVLDDRTIVYHFNLAYPYQLMDANDGPIMPKHVLDRIPHADFGRLQIEELPTDGPFKLGSWEKGQALTLVRNEKYYEKGKPYLDKVIFKIIPDQVTLLTQLKNGEIDCMEMVPPGEMNDIKKNHTELAIYDFPTRAYNYIGWNAARPLFASARVRRALTMAIDCSLINENIYYGFARECTSPFPPIIWAYNPNIKPIPYDTAGARRILAEEGFRDTNGDGWLEKDGMRFEFELLTQHGNQLRNDIQVTVQDMLRKVGIKVDPLTLEWTVFLEHIKSGNYDAQVNGWRVGTKADLSPIWACESRGPEGYNRVNYCNPLVDSLNAAACSMLDFEKAKPIFYRVQELIYEDQPYTFLNVLEARNVVHSRFKGVKPDAISMYHYLQDWWVSNETK